MSMGVCVSPGFLPSRAQVDELNPPFLRSVLYVPEDLHRLRSLGRKLWLTVNNEFSMVRGWEGWEDAMRFVAANAAGSVIGVSCGGELDIFWSRDRNDVPPGFAADLVNRAQPILSSAGIAVATTSVAGPEWVAYLDNMLRYCSPDYVCLDPYGWAQAGLENKLSELEHVAQGHKLFLPEVGVHISDAGGEQGQAGLVTHAAQVLRDRGAEGSWFAWADQVAAPWERGETAFGLLAEDGRRRPAWQAYAALGQQVAPAGPDLSAWAGTVGGGILDAMRRDGTQPAWRASRWPDYGEATRATNGDIYTWVSELQRVIRVPAEAA